MIQRPGLEQIDGSGATAGQVPVWNPDNGGVWEPATPAPAGVATVTAGAYVVVDDTDPRNIIVSAMVPMTTLNASGLPEIVFDSDGHIVYTEAP